MSYLLIFWGLPAGLALGQLWLERKESTRHFYSYAWWSFVPFWNLVASYFVIKRLRGRTKNYFKQIKPCAKKPKFLF